MSFYKSIAPYYDKIFPLNYDQVGFVLESTDDVENANILDVGCGTGNLTHALSKMCKNITGVDLDEEMLDIARGKTLSTNVDFVNGNMISLTEKLNTDDYETIVCFGNTLVHLNGSDEIEVFIKHCKTLLKKGGKLLIQIINYNYILDEGIDGLPTIENDNIKFARHYDYLPEYNEIIFKTELLVKTTCTIIENKQNLYPIRQQELIEMLDRNGFTVKGTFGNFKKEPLNLDSIPFIIEAEMME